MTPLVALTIDLDLVDYQSGTVGDELADRWDDLAPVVTAAERPVTWFLRVDRAVGEHFGDALWLWRKHRARFDDLLARRHAVGWHHHAYDGDRPVLDPARLLAEVERWGPIARAEGWTLARMGWAYHTEATMDALERLGFSIDSSAMPRPRYPWDVVPKDWEDTPLTPYHPSRDDHRRPGRPARSILQMPITTAPLPAPTDTRPVRRSLSPAYAPEAFRRAFSAVEHLPLVVLVLHPYELGVTAAQHPLFGAGPAGFAANIAWLEARGAQLVTLTEAARRLVRLADPRTGT